MSEEMVTTGVDDLIEYCRGKDKVAMQDVAKVLGIPHETLQAWVDFLVEEKILGIEYKFTKPYIYINKETDTKAKVIEHTQLSMDDVKNRWLRHARQKKIPDDKLDDLWRSHVEQALDRQREYFDEQARRRHASNKDSLWKKYREHVIAQST